MRKLGFPVLAALMTTIALGTAADAAGLTDSLKAGRADLKSAGPLAFGADGVLFVGDSLGASVFALDTADTKPLTDAAEVDGVNAKIAALLGTTPDNILINDVAVNPLSKRAYISVSRGRGPAATPVIVRTAAGGKLEVLSFDNIKFSKATLPNAPTMETQTRRGGSARLVSITDVAYVEGKVIVAGLSNEEFASNLRQIPFPFTSTPRGTSIEIYHGSHGRYETHAPVRTFVPYKIRNEDVILASYTCTPLVVFRTAELANSNAKVEGKTIAELGSGNTPLDMIIYEKGGSHYILMANTDLGVVKLSAENLDKYKAITAETDVTGVPAEQVKVTGVEHLTRLDQDRALLLVAANGKQSLKAMPLP